MRVTKADIFRIALPVVTLGLFYGTLFWFTIKKPRTKPLPRPILTAEQSQALLTASKASFGAGKYQEALQRTIVLHEAYPDNHLYIEQLAQIYDRLGNYQQEAQCWEEYLDHAPRPETGCPQIGDAYWKQGAAGEKKAIAAYERCLKLDPANSDFFFYLGHALEKSGELDRAAEIYQRGIQLSPAYTDLRLGLARVWIQQDKLEEAKRAVQEILAASPNNVDALLVMGLGYYRQGDFKAAKKYLERGAKLSDSYTDFRVILGDIAWREKNTPEAIRQYTRVLELQPTNSAIRARLDGLKGAAP